MVNLTYFFPSVADRVKNIEKMEGKKVLVTGASGLIGNHVVATLVDVGAEVHVFRNNNLPYVMKGVREFDFISKGYDYLFHLAGYGQPRKFSENKFNTIAINTNNLFELISCLKDNGSILFASTSELYSGLTVEATEDMIGTTTPAHPRACYIESKRCGETIIHVLNEMGYNGKIARIALAYGPGVRFEDTRVMSDFIRAGLETGSIQPNGGLNNIRTYCYVTDTVQMLFNILLNGKQTVYNVAGESSITIEKLAYAISGKLGIWTHKYSQKDINDGAPNVVRVSTEKYQNEFGKMKFTPLDDGLEKTIAWFKYSKGDKNGA